MKNGRNPTNQELLAIIP